MATSWRRSRQRTIVRSDTRRPLGPGQVLQAFQFGGYPHVPCTHAIQEGLAMAEALRQPRRFEPAVPVPGEVGGPRARGAYRILYLLFIIAPIAVGLDKFAHVLVNWDQYLAPVVDQMLPIHVSA